MVSTDTQIRAAITERAANWYAAHRGGPQTDSDRAEFFSWLRASPVHVEEYLAVAALEHDLAAATDDPAMSWDALLELAHQADGSVVQLNSGPSESTPAPARAHRVYRGWVGAIAIALAAFCVAIIGLVWRLHDGQWLGLAKTYQTARGAQSSWRLPDGSVLHLNTTTEATVRFTANERRLDLDHGQAFFEVAHDSKRPFRVVSGGTSVVAVGTEFDVYRQPDTMLVTVVNGQVDVFQATGMRDPPMTSVSGPTTRKLTVVAGQRLEITGGVLPVAPTPADLRQATAWQQRQIVFDQRPLGEVANEFNRYNSMPVTISDPTLQRLRISGVFDAYDVDSFAAFLMSLDDVRVDRGVTAIAVSRSHDAHASAHGEPAKSPTSSISR